MKKDTFKKLLRIIIKDKVSEETLNDIMFLVDEFAHENKVLPTIQKPTTKQPTIYADICSCNPKNGGSGICGCTIGDKIVSDLNPSHTYIQTSWVGTSTLHSPNSIKSDNSNTAEK